MNKHDYPTEYRVKNKRSEWHVQCDCVVLVTARRRRSGRRQNWRWRLATLTSLESIVARVRGVTTLQALLIANARRDAQRIGARWKTTTTTAEIVSYEGDMVAAMEGREAQEGVLAAEIIHNYICNIFY